MKKISGSCHCSNIRYDLSWPGDINVIATRECGCSFCVKHGGAWTSNTDAVLHASISDSGKTSKYQFGTKTAAFYVCEACGVVPFVTSEIDDRVYAVVNTNTFDDRTDLRFSASATDFDGEDTSNRLTRRQNNWINQVEIFVADN